MFYKNHTCTGCLKLPKKTNNVSSISSKCEAFHNTDDPILNSKGKCIAKITNIKEYKKMKDDIENYR